MNGNGATMDGIAIEGCTIAVRVEGEDSKPALVLSHMLGADLTLWDELVPGLLEHFRVVRYDTRGHGGSGLGDTPVTLARLGRDVLAILDALGIERAHFLGLSMGGAVGLWLLAHAPARIERAVIAGSAAKLGEPAVWNPRIAAALADGMEQAVEPTIERWFSPAFVERAAEPVEAIRALLRATAPSGYAACCAALRDMDLREAVRGVSNPVLVLRGTDDPTVTAADTSHLVEAMVAATAVEVDARHCAVIEDRAAFAAAVVKFFTARHAPRRATGRAAAKGAKTQAKPSARRGGRSLVAARRPVARTAPVSGKAVAKASATRKTAARAATPAPSRRRTAAKPAARAPAPKPASRKETSSRPAALKPASTRALGRTRAGAGTSASAARGATSARRVAPKTSAKAKPPSAAALRAAAAKAPARTAASKVASGRAGKAGASKPAAKAVKAPIAKARTKTAPAKAASVKLEARKTTAARATGTRTDAAKATKTTAIKTTATKTTAAKMTTAKAVAVKAVPAKATAARTAPVKKTPAKSTPAKSTPAKPTPAPRRPAGRGASGPGRRKP